MRRLHILLIALAVIVFLAISAVLARVFSADGAERAAITTLLRAEARGDQQAMLAQIKNCGTSEQCRARVAANVAALTHAGTVSILQLQPSTSFSLMSTLGTARVAWDVGNSLPIVQCVRVRRAGNAFSGLTIELLAISPRINSEADCPTTF